MSARRKTIRLGASLCFSWGGLVHALFHEATVGPEGQDGTGCTERLGMGEVENIKYRLPVLRRSVSERAGSAVFQGNGFMILNWSFLLFKYLFSGVLKRLRCSR